MGYVKPFNSGWSGLPTRLPKLLLYSLILAALILLVNLGVIFFVHDEDLKVMFFQLPFPLWNLLATIALLYAAKRSALHSRRLALAWGLLAAGRLLICIGEITTIVLVIRLGAIPFPSLADAFFLSLCPLFLLGILLLPSQRFKPLDWVKMGLDMSIVLCASVLILWNYWLGPLIASVREQSRLVQVLSLAYPVENLILLWVLLVLLYRQRTGQKPSALLLLALGIGCQIAISFLYGSYSIGESFVSTDWLGFGWILTNLIFMITGIWQATSMKPALTTTEQQATNTEVQPGLNTRVIYFPYVGLVIVYLLLVWRHFEPMPMSFAWMALGVGGIIGLVLIRQMVNLKENSLLFIQLQAALEQLHEQALALQITNQNLQIEIDERKQAEARLAHDAVHDALTDLPNRVLFMERLRHALDFARRHEDYRFSVLFLDLDRFKVINDSLGHMAGDQLLIALAHRLRLCMRAGDTVARLGGDEFVILLEDTDDGAEASTTANRIQEQLKQPFSLAGHQVVIAASIGIVVDAQTYERPEDTIRDADLAMYHAKALGKAQWTRFSVEMRAQAMTRLALESDLRQVLVREELELYYQPIVALPGEQITGFEALLRWHHPTRGLVSPLEFIPIAEETGLIIPIGHWVLDQACRQLHAWQMRFPQSPPLTMNVNISGTQFRRPRFH